MNVKKLRETRREDANLEVRKGVYDNLRGTLVENECGMILNVADGSQDWRGRDKSKSNSYFTLVILTNSAIKI